jgi:MFS family permease
MQLGRYVEVLRTPGVLRVTLFAGIGRLPFAIVPLSIVLLMREEGYHYGEVGAAVGAEGLAIAFTAGFVGRLVDRGGRRRVILLTGTVCIVALSAWAVAILAHAPIGLIVAVAAIQGVSIPPISASMRSLWGRLVPEETLESAYAFDAIQLEFVFIVGPLIAAGLATALTPAVGVFLCAALYLTAAVGFATAPAAGIAADDQAERTRAGALRSAGIRTLALAAAVTAISFGGLEVALTAFAEEEGSRGAVGPLVTIWSLGSVIGGLWYGARTWKAPAEKRFLILMVVLAAGSAPLPLAPSIAVMAIMLVFTGLALAPLATTEFALIDRLAPTGTLTEAYSWLVVANVLGAGLGSLVAGVLAEEASVEWALATAGIACTLGIAVAVAGRRTLRPAVAAGD